MEVIESRNPSLLVDPAVVRVRVTYNEYINYTDDDFVDVALNAVHETRTSVTSIRVEKFPDINGFILRITISKD